MVVEEQVVDTHLTKEEGSFKGSQVYSTSIPGYEIRNATLSEMDQILSWGSKLQWEPGVHDALPFWMSDPKGIFVGTFAESEGGGERKIVASLIAPKWGADKGFFGYYIVEREENRKRGFGLELFKHGLAYLGGRRIALDAVEAQVHNYEKSGFTVTRPTVRYVYTPPTQVTYNLNTEFPSIRFKSLLDLEPERDWQSIADFEYRASGMQRTREFIQSFFFNALALGKSMHGLVAYDGDDQPIGLIVIRRSTNYNRVGPWYSLNNTALAHHLFQRVVAEYSALIGDPSPLVLVDAVTSNKGMSELADVMGFKEVCRFYRMWTGGSSAIVDNLEITYAGISIEVG